MSQSLLWRYIVLLTVGVQLTTECYIRLVSVWREDSNKLQVRSSACPSICNTNKNAYFFIINSRIIIRISDERAWHILQENKSVWQLHFAYQVKGVEVLYKKIKCHFRIKVTFEDFRPNSRKNLIIAQSFFVIDGEMIVGIPGKSA